jgi:phage terminase large subunit-like protein
LTGPVPSIWIRNPSDEEAIRQGCYFDDVAAERPILFIERFCKQSIGRWHGAPLLLFDWQKDFLRRVFGWKRADGLRRFRVVYLEVAKKNGKSTMLAGLELELDVADGEGSPEIHILAGDKKQAGIIFNESARMVEASPELKKRLQVIGGSLPAGNIEKRIIDTARNGVILCNSSVADTKDGMNPSVAIFDELHRQPNRDLWDVYVYAGVAREQYLRLSITTAGEDESGIWHEQREHAEAVNKGTRIDTEFLGVVYRALPTDDLDSPETWRKANPSLGLTFSEDDFRRELETAKRTPHDLALFQRLRLNIVTRTAPKWMDMEKWKACGAAVPDLHELRTVPCYGGGDLSTTTDLSAVAFVFGDQSDGYDVHLRCYLPEDNIVALERRDKVAYRAWAERGWLTLTPGESIDYEFIRRDINEVVAECNLRGMYFDRYNATQLCTQLAESDGIAIEYLTQGFISLSPPTKELLRLVLAGKIRHGNHPILLWAISNAIAEEDAAGNVKLSKKKSRQKIDPAAALVNAIARAMSDANPGGSIYNERDLVLL